MESTRRRFLKTVATGAGLLALAPSASYASSETEGYGPEEVGMLYDSTKCVGCKACVYACRRENFDANPDPILNKKDAAEPRWQDVYELDYRTKNIIKLYQNPDDKTDFAFIKRQCNHCKHPGCVSACPVKAMTKDAVTGIVQYDQHICIGCRYCQLACPFNVPAFEWHRAIPKISKCELCRQTESKIPACTRVCPAKAVIFGKCNDLLAQAHARIEETPERGYKSKVYGEHDYGGTNVIYIARVDFEKLGLPNLPNYSYASFSEHIQHSIYKTFMHVPIFPVVLYTALAVVVFKNRKKRRERGEEE